MSQFFISCKESRIESNRSFYGCFHLGPFDPSQSLTIANALRRTLLSEHYGLGIVSVEIEGATHEYSSLPGVRDSVLDILLNFKEIVLKKTTKNFKPQVGYLRARGPGVVRASHLRLPPFIQCVDPDQYIATLAENGFLNIKFVIQYGNKWLSSSTSLSGFENPSVNTKEADESAKYNKSYQSSSAFNFHLKKRRLILKKLKQSSLSLGSIGSETLTNKNSNPKIFTLFTQSTLFLSKYTKKRNISRPLEQLKGEKYPALNLKNGLLRKLSKSIEKDRFKGSDRTGKNLSSNSRKVKVGFSNSNPLTIDAVFNPINKVNYIIEVSDFKMAPSKMQTSFETSELYDMLKTTKVVSDFLSSDHVDKDIKNYMQSQLIGEPLLETDFESIQNDSNSLNENSNTLKTNTNASTNEFPNGMPQGELDQILEIKREINALKKETIKHNITIEIWTNGSIHPRDALYQAFNNLIQLFAKLNKIQAFGVNQFALNSLNGSFKDLELENTKSTTHNAILKVLTKKVKMGEIPSTLIQDLLPLNETSFLSTYVSPKLKNYYLNNESLTEVLKSPILKKQSDFELSSIQKTETINEKLSLSNNVKSEQQPLLSLSTDSKKTALLKADIGILNLSLRSYTRLKRLKINSIEELVNLSKKDLINLKKLGKSSVEEIQKGLERFALSLSNLNL
jgi:DNA-directed RNA polymerase alpha subunit